MTAFSSIVSSTFIELVNVLLLLMSGILLKTIHDIFSKLLARLFVGLTLDDFTNLANILQDTCL
jgi:hypothetical protein